MQNINADVQQRVLGLVRTILQQNAIAAEVDRDTPLVDVGLTSMDMVNLMLGVEAEFDFMLPQPEITPENFQSVGTLERMILKQLRTATAPDREPRSGAPPSLDLIDRSGEASPVCAVKPA